MGWLQLVGSLKLEESFAHSCLFDRALLQKRPVILRSLLIVATLSTKDSATHCSIALCQTLQHTATHCNKVLPTITALLHYTRFCHTLQHSTMSNTTTHYNTLQQSTTNNNCIVALHEIATHLSNLHEVYAKSFNIWEFLLLERGKRWTLRISSSAKGERFDIWEFIVSYLCRFSKISQNATW